MAYQTGTATSNEDLLQKLSTFLSGIGWTIHADETITDGWWLSVSHANAGTHNLYSGPADLNASYSGAWVTCRMASGYDSGASHTAQPNIGANVYTNYLNGPFTAYHFFAETSYCHIVVEVSSGHFRHFGFGMLNKYSTWTGGEYSYGTCWQDNGVSYIDDPDSNRHTIPFDDRSYWATTTTASDTATRVRTDIDANGILDQRFSHYDSDNYPYCSGGIRHTVPYDFNYQRFRATPNTFNGLTPFLPIQPFLKRPAGNGAQGFLGGVVDNMRYANMTNFAPGDTVSIGSDEWLVFPAVIKNNPTPNDYNSGVYGYAYKKVT